MNIDRVGWLQGVGCRLLPACVRSFLVRLARGTSTEGDPAGKLLVVPLAGSGSPAVMQTYAQDAGNPEGLAVLHDGLECRIVRLLPGSGRTVFRCTHTPPSRTVMGLTVHSQAANEPLHAIEVRLEVSQKGRRTDHTFELPLRQHDINVNFRAGQGWVDFVVPTGGLEAGDFEVAISYRPVGLEGSQRELLEHGVRYNEGFVQPCADNRPSPPPSGTVAVTPPRSLAQRGCQARKIIVLSGESMIDPSFAWEAFGIRSETPALDVLSRDSERYSQACSLSDSTLGAAGALFTGLFPTQHGVYSYAREHEPEKFQCQYIPSRVRTLAEILKDRGFYTAGLVATRRFDWRYGYARGFDRYVCDRTGEELDPAGNSLMREATALLRDHRNEDLFLFVHVGILHPPYRLIGENVSHVIEDIEALRLEKSFEVQKRIYGAMFGRMDRAVGDFLAVLRDQGMYDRSLIILTGDHGWYLHPWYFHQDYALFETRIRVPLWIKRMGIPPPEPAVHPDACNQSIVAFRAIHEALGIELPEHFRNAPQAGSSYSDVSVSETVTHPGPDDISLAVRQGAHKYFTRYKWDPAALILKDRVSEVFLTRRNGPAPAAGAGSAIPGIAADLQFFEEGGAEDRRIALRNFAERHLEESFAFNRRIRAVQA